MVGFNGPAGGVEVSVTMVSSGRCGQHGQQTVNNAVIRKIYTISCGLTSKYC
jgi:hypothetical protein